LIKFTQIYDDSMGFGGHSTKKDGDLMGFGGI
jgi:hypothetical protein